MNTFYKDRRVLYPDYIPGEVPFREEQEKQIKRFLRFAYSNEHLFVHGPRGTGKTVLIKKCLEELPVVNPLVTAVYCIAGNTEYETTVNIATSAGIKLPRKGWALTDIIQAFVLPWVNGRPGPVVFVIDEIDKTLEAGAEWLFYYLSRTDKVNTLCIGQNPRSPLSLANSPAGSSYIPLYLDFPRYTLNELHHILNERAQEAFNEGVITDDDILYVANTAYHYGHNDARFAIALLRYAAGFAEEAQSEHVTKNNVDKALGHLERYNILQTVTGLPRPALAILYIFYSQHHIEMAAADLHKLYNENASLFAVRTYGRLRFEQYLNDLSHDRLVNTYVKGKGHARGTAKIVARSDLIEREETLQEIRQFTYWPPCQSKTRLKGVFGGEL